MAKVLPDMSEVELYKLAEKSPGEAQVYRACRLLPDAWVVLHSIRSLTLEPGDGPQDREGDFIILHPEYGMLVIEVKSGAIVFRNMKWYRRLPGVDIEIKDPFEQSCNFKHSLLKRLSAHIRWEPLRDQRMLCRHAVLLPDVKRADPIRLPQVEPELVGAAPELSKLESWIENVYRFGASTEAWHKLEARGVEIILSILAAPFTTESLLGFRIGQESRKQLHLTSEQWRTNQKLLVENELAIAGAAGTGKTLLALRRAQDCAKAGLRTLLLCYNRALADFLKHENFQLISSREVTQEHLTTSTFEAFCRWVVTEHAGPRVKEDFFARAVLDLPGQDESEVQWPQAMALALEECPLQYDAIVIDEGQDFSDRYWFALNDIWQKALKRCVFFDPNQSIFRRAQSFPVGPERTLTLCKNCRNTMVIHEISYRFYQGPPEVEPPPIPGQAIVRWEEPSIRTQAARLVREVELLIRKERVEPEQIAILVLSSRGKGVVFDAAKGAFDRRIPLSIGVYGQNGHVLIDTVKRFKGLESSVIVIWANEEPEADAFRGLRYVGFSRARSILVALGTSTAVNRLLGK